MVLLTLGSIMRQSRFTRRRKMRDVIARIATEAVPLTGSIASPARMS